MTVVVYVLITYCCRSTLVSNPYSYGWLCCCFCCLYCSRSPVVVFVVDVNFNCLCRCFCCHFPSSACCRFCYCRCWCIRLVFFMWLVSVVVFHWMLFADTGRGLLIWCCFYFNICGTNCLCLIWYIDSAKSWRDCKEFYEMGVTSCASLKLTSVPKDIFDSPNGKM